MTTTSEREGDTEGMDVVDISAFADAIEAFVKGRDYVSFVELQNNMGDFPTRGDLTIGMDPPNVMLWGGLSQELVDALDLLRVEKRIFIWPASFLVYLADGACPLMPIAKGAPRNGRFVKERWAPVTLRTVPLPEKRTRRK